MLRRLPKIPRQRQREPGHSVVLSILKAIGIRSDHQPYEASLLFASTNESFSMLIPAIKRLTLNRAGV
ncbi:MAG: hypothetical protein JWM11_3094 [Planctomycetaceae bacterium]|nr:hypothetical protein [Planctomycetaceae bacterium]